jgi:hypothetical protein
VQTWIEHVESSLGVKPIIYTGKNFWEQNVGSDAFSDYPLWIAQWGPDCPNLPAQWSDWKVFQTSATGQVDGIVGDVDTNLFNGSRADLEDFAFASAPLDCGDGICGIGESNAACAIDCAPCPLIEGTGSTIDDGGGCFRAGGKTEYIRLDEDAGHGGSFKWTAATDYPSTYNYGVWRLLFEEAGRYQVEVHVPDIDNKSHQTIYRISHAGSHADVAINQQEVSGWVALGSFDFARGGRQWLRLDDNTGEETRKERKIVFDAIRLTREGDEAPPPADKPDDPEATNPDWPDEPGGCQTTRGRHASVTLLLAMLLVVRRRRRDQR